MRFFISFLTAAGLLLTACDNDATTPDTGDAQRSAKKTKLKDVPIPNKVDSIPAKDKLGFLEEPCLLWNIEEIAREDRRVERKDKRRTGTRAGRRNQTQASVQELQFETTPGDIPPLSLAQLRETAIYHGVGTRAAIEKLSKTKLFDETEDPFFSVVLNKANGKLYSRVNIAAGDNPLDLVFEYNSLVPVAVVSDDSLQFCAKEIIEKE